MAGTVPTTKIHDLLDHGDTTDTTHSPLTTTNGSEVLSRLCSVDDPFSHQIFKDMSIGRTVMLTLACILSLMTILIFIEEIYFIRKHLPASSTRRVKIIWILGLFPAYSFTALLALLVPRAHFIASIHNSLYLSVALNCFVLLIFDYYGGFEAATVILKEEESSIAAPPILCCCGCCLPTFKVTRKFLTVMKRFVLQMAVVGPIVRFISSVLWMDGRYNPGQVAFDEVYVYLNTIVICSSILGIYGLQIIYRISQKPLEQFRIRSKFFSVQLTVIIANLQHPLLGILVTLNVIKCTDPLASDTRANMLYDALIVLEMFILSIVARMLFRRRSGNLDYLITRPSLTLTLIEKDEEKGMDMRRNNNGDSKGNDKAFDKKAEMYKFTLSSHV